MKNTVVVFNNRVYTVDEIVAATGLPRSTVLRRIRMYMTAQELMTLPYKTTGVKPNELHDDRR